MDKKVYPIRFRDKEGSFSKEGTWLPTRIKEWEIIPTPGQPVIVDPSIEGDAPTEVMQEFTRFMTQSREVRRNGFTYDRNTYPYRVTDGSNTWLYLCEDLEGKAKDVPSKVI